VEECGGVWRSVEECGGVWRECGGVWRSVEECGGVWRSVEECGGSVEECGGVWRSVEECGGVWRSVEECGGVMEECGGVWRSVEECGCRRGEESTCRAPLVDESEGREGGYVSVEGGVPAAQTLLTRASPGAQAQEAVPAAVAVHLDPAGQRTPEQGLSLHPRKRREEEDEM